LIAAVESRITLPERLTALALLGVALVLRIPYIFHYRFNSDEPQHLHVVWGWTHGLVQYRDIFDNHSPLFHLAMAPLLVAAGERPETLFAMRFAMLPLWLAALALTFTIASRLYSRRVALWSAVLLSVHFRFFFVSLELRTDVLWTVVWLAALAALVGGPISTRRAFGAGALLGVALGVSQKTILLVACLAAGAALTLTLTPGIRRQWAGRRAVAKATAAAAGFLVVPLVLVASFYAAGALGPLWYDTVQHNLLAGMGRPPNVWRALLFPTGLGLLLYLARPMIRSANGDRQRSLRLMLLLTGAVYYLSLECFWPVVTAQDWLPADPLIAIFAVAGLSAWATRRGDATAPTALLATVLVAELGAVVLTGPVWMDRAAPQVSLVRDTLRLTSPGDCVIDAKGETVFRRRASTWVLESITMERLRRGLIPDTLPEDAVAGRCCVATLEDSRFTDRAKAFLAASYVRVGHLRVVGALIGELAFDVRPVTFSVAIPARYAVVAERGTFNGSLDGTRYAGPRALAVGPHELVPDAPTEQLAVVWAQAVERGFSPWGPQ
jgi:uncharacterized membrane protein YGL010W